CEAAAERVPSQPAAKPSARCPARHLAQALPGSWVDLDDRHPPPGFDTRQVESRDDPVLGEAEGEVWLLVEFHAGVLSEPQIRPGRFSTTDTAGSVTLWA